MHLTGERPPAASPSAHQPTPAQAAHLRAGGNRLLVAGFLGTHVLGLLTIVAFAVARGGVGAVSAAVGVVVVLLYRVLGQWVTVRMAGRQVNQQLAVALGSLGVRVSALLLLAAVWFSLPADVAARFDVVALAVGVLAAEIGWTGALLLASLRARVLVYDEPAEVSPTTDESPVAATEPGRGRR